MQDDIKFPEGEDPAEAGKHDTSEPDEDTDIDQLPPRPHAPSLRHT